MGIIKAVKQAIGGGFADTWQEVIEPDNIGDQTVYARGVLVNRGQNKKGSDDIVSNGSIIHVYDNQFMILVDGGKIVDYTAEPGYYKVSNSSMPSLFNGQFGDSLKETFDRVRFGGQTPQSQKVYYINLQEIKGIKFSHYSRRIHLQGLCKGRYSAYSSGDHCKYGLTADFLSVLPIRTDGSG